MTEKLVSIVMPTYCCGEYLRESVASVRAQSWENWELLMVDDCSPDDTYALAQELASADGRIRLFKTPVNSQNKLYICNKINVFILFCLTFMNNAV